MPHRDPLRPRAPQLLAQPLGAAHRLLPARRVPRRLLADPDRREPGRGDEALFHREERDPLPLVTRPREEAARDLAAVLRPRDRGARDDPRPPGLHVRDARVALGVEGVAKALLEHLERRRVPRMPAQERASDAEAIVRHPSAPSPREARQFAVASTGAAATGPTPFVVSAVSSTRAPAVYFSTSASIVPFAILLHITQSPRSE